MENSSEQAARQAAIAQLWSCIDRSQRLIEQLLHLSRAEPGVEVHRNLPVSLSELVRSLVGNLSVRADRRRIDLGADAKGDIFVTGDPQQLTVLLGNLMENAMRYTPSGGVVDVVATTVDGRPALCVIDNGPGIPPAERSRVFDRFYRGEGAQAGSSDDVGSGLGLAIVQAIAGQHRATVALLTPASGVGLEVRVVFQKPELPTSRGTAPSSAAVRAQRA